MGSTFINLLDIKFIHQTNTKVDRISLCIKIYNISDIIKVIR